MRKRGLAILILGAFLIVLINLITASAQFEELTAEQKSQIQLKIANIDYTCWDKGFGPGSGCTCNDYPGICKEVLGEAFEIEEKPPEEKEEQYWVFTLMSKNKFDECKKSGNWGRECLIGTDLSTALVVCTLPNRECKVQTNNWILSPIHYSLQPEEGAPIQTIAGKATETKEEVVPIIGAPEKVKECEMHFSFIANFLLEKEVAISDCSMVKILPSPEDCPLLISCESRKGKANNQFPNATFASGIIHIRITDLAKNPVVEGDVMWAARKIDEKPTKIRETATPPPTFAYWKFEGMWEGLKNAAKAIVFPAKEIGELSAEEVEEKPAIVPPEEVEVEDREKRPIIPAFDPEKEIEVISGRKYTLTVGENWIDLTEEGVVPPSPAEGMPLGVPTSTIDIRNIPLTSANQIVTQENAINKQPGDQRQLSADVSSDPGIDVSAATDEDYLNLAVQPEPGATAGDKTAKVTIKANGEDLGEFDLLAHIPTEQELAAMLQQEETARNKIIIMIVLLSALSLALIAVIATRILKAKKKKGTLSVRAKGVIKTYLDKGTASLQQKNTKDALACYDLIKRIYVESKEKFSQKEQVQLYKQILDFYNKIKAAGTAPAL